MSSEHVEVLRNLSEVCRAAIKAGDWKVDGACDPDAVLRRADAAIAALSAPQPHAEAQPDWEVAPPGTTHYQPHQDLYYKRVSASEWYVWNRMEPREPLRWLLSPGTSDSAEWVVRPTDSMPPPSAPVGAAEDMVLDAIERRELSAPVGVEEHEGAMTSADYIEHCAGVLREHGYRVTASTLADIATEHRALAQQPAAVDEADKGGES